MGALACDLSREGWRRFVPGGKIFGVAGSQRLGAATSTPTTAKEPPVEQFEIDHLATVKD